MKEFLVYTALRIGLFLGCLGVVLGVWWAATGADAVSDTQVLVSVIIAFLVSGALSYRVLHGQREELARKVETRAERMQSRLEEMKAKEDPDQ